MTQASLQEVVDRSRRQHEAHARAMSDEDLSQAISVAAPFRRSVFIEEVRRRTYRPQKSVYQWLREPAL